MKKFVCFLILLCVLFTVSVSAAEYSLDLPYESYIYNNKGEPLVIPAPYVSGKTITGFDLGLSGFKDVSDIFYDKTGYVYICDTGNNRVIITDKNFKLIASIASFKNSGADDSLNSPTGVFAKDNTVYVADSKNARILAFNKNDFSLKKVFSKPVIKSLNKNGADYTYTPLKIVVDAANRIYVIAEGINQGLVQLDENGKFSSFLGAPSVVPDVLEIMWRGIATKEKKARMQKFVPTEYDSILIDDNGFIYATSKTSSISPVVKLNSKGTDVLPKVANYGDQVYKDKEGNKIDPYFIDVAVNQNGTYITIDSNTNKIYAYDASGQFLYAFSAKAFQKGTFYSASGIEIIDNTICVSDRSKGTITVFTATAFGANINSAIEFYRRGLYGQAGQMWQNVYLQSSNYVLSIVGLAKIDIQNGQYRQAMTRLESIHDHKNYSIAFEKWRNDVIRKYFSVLLLGSFVLICLLFFLFKWIKKIKFLERIKEMDGYKKYKYGTYVMFHPFDGFWDLKREKKGNAKTASVILGLFILTFIVRAQFSGYVVTSTISSEVNGLLSCLMVIIPLLFFVISNWCFTTLMDGEGSIKDIYMATCYALKPYVILSVPLFIMSHVLTSNEAMFYNVLDKVCIFWVFALLFFGMMVIHDYSLSKAILTLVLTIVGICIIVFILLLFLSIIQNVFQFSTDYYKEISLRMYE